MPVKKSIEKDPIMAGVKGAAASNIQRNESNMAKPSTQFFTAIPNPEFNLIMD